MIEIRDRYPCQSTFELRFRPSSPRESADTRQGNAFNSSHQTKRREAVIGQVDGRLWPAAKQRQRRRFWRRRKCSCRTVVANPPFVKTDTKSQFHTRQLPRHLERPKSAVRPDSYKWPTSVLVNFAGFDVLKASYKSKPELAKRPFFTFSDSGIPAERPTRWRKSRELQCQFQSVTLTV